MVQIVSQHLWTDQVASFVSHIQLASLRVPPIVPPIVTLRTPIVLRFPSLESQQVRNERRTSALPQVAEFAGPVEVWRAQTGREDTQGSSSQCESSL